MARKSNSKSIRLSDEVLHYIEDYEGDGFNEKFENIILYSMKSRSDLEAQLKYLNEKIKTRQDKLDKISAKVSTMDITVNAIFNLSEEVNRLQRQIAGLLDDA